MSRPSPRVSIGIPVYNGEQYLRQAVESFLNQTFEDFELIISDNASTDQTQAICNQLQQQDSRIRYDRLPENCGAINNFNRLVGLSRGEFFKWAAADDICLPGYLEALVRMLDEEADAVWCHSRSIKIDETGRMLCPDDPAAEGLANSVDAGMPRVHHDSNRPHLRFRGVLLGTAWCADCYGLIRLQVLRQTVLMPRCFGSEKVLIAELALHGKYLEYPEYLFLHRVHSMAAGHLTTSEDQQKYVLGKDRNQQWDFSRVTLLREYVRVVHRTTLSLNERLFAYIAIGSWLCQFHKWWHVLCAFIFRRPLKGYPNTT